MKIWIQLPTNKGLQTLPNFQILKKGLRHLVIIVLAGMDHLTGNLSVNPTEAVLCTDCACTVNI